MKVNKRLTVTFFILALLAAGPLMLVPEKHLDYYARIEMSQMGERNIASTNDFDINLWRPLYEIIDPDNFLGLVHYQTFVESGDEVYWPTLMTKINQRMSEELKSTNHYSEEILFQIITNPKITKQYLKFFAEEFSKNKKSNSLFILPTIQQSSSQILVDNIKNRKNHFLPLDQDGLTRYLDGLMKLKIPSNKKDYQYLAGSIHFSSDKNKFNITLYRYFKLNNSNIFRIKSKTEHSEIKFLHYQDDKDLNVLPITVKTTYEFDLTGEVKLSKKSDIMFGKIVYTDNHNNDNTLYYGQLNSHFLTINQNKKTEFISTIEAITYDKDNELKIQWSKALPELISNEFELIHKKAYAKGLKFGQLLKEAKDE